MQRSPATGGLFVHPGAIIQEISSNNGQYRPPETMPEILHQRKYTGNPGMHHYLEMEGPETFPEKATMSMEYTGNLGMHHYLEMEDAPLQETGCREDTFLDNSVTLS